MLNLDIKSSVLYKPSLHRNVTYSKSFKNEFKQEDTIAGTPGAFGKI